MLKFIYKILIFSFLFIFISPYYERFYPATVDGKERVYKTINLIEEDTIITNDNTKCDSFEHITYLVVDGAHLTIKQGLTISKSVQQSKENYENSDEYKYGLTSHIVVIGPNSKVTINNAIIEVDSSFSNAIVALNGGKVILKGSKIITKQKYSKGIVALTNSFIDISGDSIIMTEGNFSPCLEVDINKGRIEGNSLHLDSKGEESPLLKALGDGVMRIEDAKGVAHNSQILVIEGSNNIQLYYCELSCFEKTDNLDKNNLNYGGIVLYKSDDNNYGSTELLLIECDLDLVDPNNENIPMFSCYNTEADITLENTETNEGHKIFMRAIKEEDSTIFTKINLNINQIGFKGKIIAEENAQINLKVDPEDLLTNDNELIGDVYQS